MANLLRNVLGTVALTVLAAGCDTARPGEGLTNGPSPTVLRAEEKPAIRDDLHEPPANAGDAALVNAEDSQGGQAAQSAAPAEEPKVNPPGPSTPK